jgi:hypothetical protein
VSRAQRGLAGSTSGEYAAGVIRLFSIMSLFLLILSGCGPEIGDNCDDSLDCAIDGSRFCDFTQPEGYCLIAGCRADECPEEAVCVEFGGDEQARTFCLLRCEENGDCRSGYDCRATDSDGDILVVILDEQPESDRYCIEKIPTI